MKDAASIYDAVHLDVTIGPGFSEAETRLNALATQVQNLQRAGTISLRVDSSGLTKAIADAERLGRAMAGVGTAPGSAGSPDLARYRKIIGSQARQMQELRLDTLMNYDVSGTRLPGPSIYNRAGGARALSARKLVGSAGGFLGIDADNLKLINDAKNAGHAAGDTYLREMGRTIAKTVKPYGGLVTRTGGDEFSVFLPKASAELTNKVGREVLANIKAMPPMGTIPGFSATIGGAVGKVGNQIINAAADDALYAAKRIAKGTYMPVGGGGGIRPPTSGMGATGGALPPSGWGSGRDKGLAVAEAAKVPPIPPGGWSAGSTKEYATNALAAAAAQNKWNAALAKAKDYFGPMANTLGQITRNVGKVAMWAVATGAIYGLIHAFKEMLTTIMAVDHAMADIRKVYQEDNEVKKARDIRILRDELIGLNVELGGNTAQTMESAVAWARMGYKRKEIMDLMRTSILATNIAELSAADATGFLTSAMVQFKIPAAGALGILDSWNELSNRTKATTRDLGDSVAITGATFQQTGDSIHYVNALTATLVQTMAKSGREVGNALRTIGTFMYRPRTMKSVKDIVGVDITKGKIGPRMKDETDADYVRRQKDNMKSQSEVLGELAGKWDTLTEKKQIDIAQTIAGARRYNYFLAIMENYDTVMDNLIISLDSSGSAERENAIYMTTLQKQVERLKASVTKLYVATGDNGLGGALNVLIRGAIGAVNALSHINLVAVAASIAAWKLVGPLSTIVRHFGELIATAPNAKTFFRDITRGIGGANLAMIAFTISVVAITTAINDYKNMASEASAATEKWVGDMETAENKATTAADNLSQLKTLRDTAKARGDTERYDKANRAIDRQAKVLAEATGETVSFVKEQLEAGHATDLARAKTEDDIISLQRKRETLKSLRNELVKSTVTEASMRAYKEATGAAGGGFWDRFGAAYASEGKMNWKNFIPFYGVGRGVKRAITGEDVKPGMIKGLEASLSVVRDELQSRELEQTQKDIENMNEELDDTAEAASGTAKEIDYLQQMLDRFAATMRELNDRENLANHLMNANQIVLDKIGNKYGDLAYNVEGYTTALYEQKDVVEGLVGITERKIAENEREQAELRANRDALITHGNTADEVDEAMQKLIDDNRQYHESLSQLSTKMDDFNNTEFNAFITLMEHQTDLARRGEDLFSRVLPSSSDAVKVGRDLGYINDEIDAIGKKSGKDLNGMLERAGIHTTNITYNMSQWQAFLDAANLSETERAKIEELITKRMDIQLDIIEKQVEEYQALSDSMRSIVDDGLWGIITGEQTALDLAKQIGLEYGKIAVQTFTGPATEGFAAGLGNAAYMLKTGRALPTGASLGIENAMVTDGALHVRDDALAAIVAQGGGGQGIGAAAAAGLGGALGSMGGQGVGRRGAAGGSLYNNAAMPYIGGALSGGIMGSGGGMAGSMFGAGMGSLGVYLSTLGPWGALAGAGVTMLSFLGNLFGRGGHATEEDTYARRQANGMGERSVSIGSAGTVQNNFYMTITYESSTDRENVRQLFDLLEDEATTRGAQVSGNVRQAAV